MMPGRIELHIEELVLEGFSPRDRHEIGAAFEQELGRLLHEQGVPAWLEQGTAQRRVPQLSGPSIQLDPKAGPAASGAQVAHAVYQGLKR